MSRGRVRPVLCFRTRSWSILNLPAEARAGWEIALDRVRDLPHDAAGFSLEHMLASAYLQGMLDGQEVQRQRTASGGEP